MKVIIIRYSEIHLKGNNREFFESALVANIKTVLKEFRYDFSRSNARYVIRNFDEIYIEDIVDAVKNVFGVHSLSIAEEVPSELKEISAAALAFSPTSGTCNRWRYIGCAPESQGGFIQSRTYCLYRHT